MADDYDLVQTKHAFQRNVAEVSQDVRDSAADLATAVELRDVIRAGRFDDHVYVEFVVRERAKGRANTLAEVERHLSAVQYDPAPYTAMKARLRELKGDGR